MKTKSKKKKAAGELPSDPFMSNRRKVGPGRIENGIFTQRVEKVSENPRAKFWQK